MQNKVALVLIALMGLALVGLACGGGDDEAAPTARPTTAGSATPPPPPASGGDVVSVVNQDQGGSGEYKFVPSDFTFSVGETVTFSMVGETEFHSIPVRWGSPKWTGVAARTAPDRGGGS